MPSLKFGILPDQEYSIKEAINSLRTNLTFCGDDIKVIAVTSCMPNEGKSTVSYQLASSFAENGKKVLHIDADMRKSVMIATNRIELNGHDNSGLSHYLSGQAKLEEVVFNTNIKGYDLIMTGPVTPNPTELLDSERFKKLIEFGRENYDLVLIDSPPLGAVIDTAVIAPNCDGAIFVIESCQVSYKMAQDVKKQLEMTGCRILGVVLNKVEVVKTGYYNRYYKGYYQKEY